MTAAGAVAATVMLQPVTFGNCLGWLHLPPAGQARNRGVVICAPIGHEALAAYRGLHDLAARCAAAGLPALRFDYPGCGDSPGEPGPAHLESCRSAILLAAEWLRHRLGLNEVALCGMRLGALLAAGAAARQPGRFASLALLAPVVSGRVHLRQLQLMAQTGAAAAAAQADGLEVAGQVLQPCDCTDLAGSDLLASLRLAGLERVLLLDRQMALGERLRAAGAVTALRFEGAEAYFTQPHLSRLPCADFTRVAHWLAMGSAPMAAPPRPPAAEDLLPGRGGVERPLRFGPGNRLAGMLCLPRAEGRRRIAVLLLNTGANPRAGVGRLGVRLARRLAELGFPSLRMDAAGVGDSEWPPGIADAAAPPDMFADTVIEDAGAGLGLLAADGTRCLVVGICAGAHAAFQLACRDERIAGLALFNLPAFDRAAGGAPALDGGPPPGETCLTRRPRMLLRRLRARCDAAAATWFGLESGLDRAGRWMRALAARNIRVLLAYSAGDRGLRELRAHFGRGGHQLARFATVRRVVLDGTDHSLAPRAMQEQVLRLIEEEALRLDAAAMPVREAPATEPWAGGTPLPHALIAAR